ncbi:hypothetical protein [uncultured Paludibaculum sp.]|uniref:hypothetical protein n=1 Tax=uncultured Paludibaculum sp. TaxID=1765020 RepID=UPI002AABF62B|nr:hypothetical protein [uncultured Paludibaculum sp.]
MNAVKWNRLGAAAGLLFLMSGLSAQPGKVAPKPLFRDPVHDGAADPVLVWNRGEQRWFMLYTNRRANVPNLPGVAWVHGTRIGIAESTDQGATWKYRGVADIDYGKPDYSLWAPDVIDDGKTYHMFLSVVPGTFPDWNAPRNIVHLTSADLLHWSHGEKLPLASDRVIDATVIRLTNGTWRLWYKNERDKSHIHYADSPDLVKWTQGGVAIDDRPGEGAKVFRWQGRYWMITDFWKGLAVYSSPDAGQWTAQAEPILRDPGKLPTDRAKGQHADIVVSGERAYIIYFTHQGGPDAEPAEPDWQRHTVLQIAELHYKDGQLSCDRDQPTRVWLAPPGH